MASSSSSSSQANRPPTAGKPDRLYVGNLSQTVDEYTLLQVFGKYGKITRLDVMYHKTGPQKGKPRGYAFVEFSNKDLHDRLLRGKKLIVTYASAAPAEDFLGPKVRRIDAPKPTALSLLKTSKKPQSAADRGDGGEIGPASETTWPLAISAETNHRNGGGGCGECARGRDPAGAAGWRRRDVRVLDAGKGGADISLGLAAKALRAL
ncbi:single-stranded nucleic acid binding protein [Trichosporon asahii var. asahii CBS 8904]|uniref:Single-stranded nucleic acid binding protein n=2 Tax=Trichosporon asahii var. asahii TaxID=189963 RepID=K1VFN7_TRIAC|nr:single-stranded nucleic acid binding protein [Trichosporon asahii var. asahii CBS 2479]EJT47973.1 single-stranded nucleic acid binding protein [Trichosporon asahii var. asahii CBS 2479]EKC99600.1 single-stranded nucleic acid binding protein [Trichosporon asahii var. asahii CBS 8904]